MRNEIVIDFETKRAPQQWGSRDELASLGISVAGAWLPKEIRKNHTYIYYGCTDHTKTDIENLILGELRIKYKIHSAGYFEDG